jgi:hypothetical protein
VWFNIYTAQQLLDNARTDGCYDIKADLDFAETGWTTAFARGTFSGQIIGNNHTLSNISVTQSAVGQQYGGTFGRITESATIKDIAFANVTYYLNSGSRVYPSSFGLFAGELATGATIENVSVSGKLLIGNIYRPTNDDSYHIGKICGNGTTLINAENVTCERNDEAFSGTPSIEVSVGENGAVTIQWI